MVERIIKLQLVTDRWWRVEIEEEGIKRYVSDVYVAGRLISGFRTSIIEISADPRNISFEDGSIPTLFIETPEYYDRPEHQRDGDTQ